jgi:hypothetical protein
LSYPYEPDTSRYCKKAGRLSLFKCSELCRAAGKD